MQDAQAIDRYFTEQMIGRQLVIDMGSSAGMRTLSRHGVQVEWLSGQVRLGDMALRSLLVADPAEAVAGRPFNLLRLKRWRRRALLALALLWTVLVATGAGWLVHGWLVGGWVVRGWRL